MAVINPHINFNGNAEEAFTFYKSVFGGEFSKILRFKDLSSPDFQVPENEKNKIMQIALPIGKVNVLIGNDIPEFMGNHELHLTEAVMYETVSADLSDLTDVYYDILCFFSPSGITSLFRNFPDFEQNKTRIAAFGPTTAKAVTDAGLILDIEAPMPNAPCMTGGLEIYIKKANNL